MANAIVETYMPQGMTLTLDLFPYASDTAAASGKTLTEATNRKGLYTATVTEGLTGWHTAHVKQSGNVIAVSSVYMTDDTSVHRTEDASAYLYLTGWSVLTTADIDARLTAYAGAKTSELLASSAALLTAINLRALTSELAASSAALLAAINSASPPTASEIASAVMNRNMGGHSSADTLGWLLHRFASNVTKSSTQIIVQNTAGVPITTQTITSSGLNQTQGPTT